MVPYGRPRLRDLFDDAPTPYIAHPPRTHRRDYYVVSDGSFTEQGSGLGAIIETGDGTRLARLSRTDDSPSSNTAEYRALLLGLSALTDYAPESARVGVLVDHDELAANVNAAALGMDHPDWPTAVKIPESGADSWTGIREYIGGFAGVRAACINSDQNPAHVLANAPEEYRHLDPSDRFPGTRDWEIPPPSRADRHADD